MDNYLFRCYIFDLQLLGANGYYFFRTFDIFKSTSVLDGRSEQNDANLKFP